jgi:hypothetical protein
VNVRSLHTGKKQGEAKHKELSHLCTLCSCTTCVRNSWYVSDLFGHSPSVDNGQFLLHGRLGCSQLLLRVNVISFAMHTVQSARATCGASGWKQGDIEVYSRLQQRSGAVVPKSHGPEERPTLDTRACIMHIT